MSTPDAGADSQAERESVNTHYDTRLPQLKWSRRIQIPFIAAVVYSVIRLLGRRCVLKCSAGITRRKCTLEEAMHLGVLASRDYSHRLWYRNHGVVVMNTPRLTGNGPEK